MASSLDLVQKCFPAVVRVEDGKKDMHIDVSKADASSKAVKNHRACALAVACKREFKLDGAVISRSVAYLINGTTATRYRVPQSATREIVSFDRGAAFAPGAYVLKAIPKAMRFGVVRKRKTDQPNKGHSNGDTPVKFRHTTEGIRASLLSRDVV